MRKLLMLIGALIMSNAYGDETVVWTVLPTSTSAWKTTSCTASGAITKPENPEKTDYRFIGWREATLDEIAYLSGQSYTPANGNTNTSLWTLTFQYGTISGASRCSSVSGSCGNTYGLNCTTSSTTPTGSGRYCWCKLTDAGPLSSKIDVSTVPWVFFRDFTSNSVCSPNCAYTCVSFGKSGREFHKKLFGID